MRSAAVRDPDELEQLVDAIAQVAAAHALDAALQHQVLAARAELVDAGVLRHVADRAPHGVLRAAHVVPGDRAPCLRPACVSVTRTRTVVDLPAPFGPSRPKTSPSRTLKETPSSACTSP